MARQSNGEMYFWLQALNRRLRSGKASLGDCHAAATLLGMLAHGEDARNLFHTTVDGRPPVDDGGARWGAAFFYWAQVKLGGDECDELAQDVADLTGLTLDIVKKAKKKYEYDVQAFIAPMDEPELRAIYKAFLPEPPVP